MLYTKTILVRNLTFKTILALSNFKLSALVDTKQQNTFCVVLAVYSDFLESSLSHF